MTALNQEAIGGDFASTCFRPSDEKAVTRSWSRHSGQCRKLEAGMRVLGRSLLEKEKGGLGEAFGGEREGGETGLGRRGRKACNRKPQRC